MHFTMNPHPMNFPTSPVEMAQAAIAAYFAASRTMVSPTQKAEAMTACFAEDAVSYDPVEAPPLASQVERQAFFAGMASLFAEVGLTEEFVSVHRAREGAIAAVKWTGKGIGLARQSLTFEGIDVFEINSAGKIQSLKAYWNPAALMSRIHPPI
jgi:steroid delta-isomerase